MGPIWMLQLVWSVHSMGSNNNNNNEIKYHNIGLDGDPISQYSRPTGNTFTTPGETIPFSQLRAIEQLSGIGIFDYDNDGDLDIFVSNYIGKPHSLFQNQLIETGTFSFLDVAGSAGFADNLAINHYGSGVCFGDIDNDGCTDLLIIGHNDYNLLYINNCDGTFTFTPNNGIDNADNLRGSSCTFGDIDNDGYIDVFIANSGNTENAGTTTQIAFTDSAYALSEPNELFLNNNGDGTFTEISQEIRDTKFSIGDDAPTIYDGNNTITWAVTMVDIDDDGFLDIVEVNDQFGPVVGPFRPRGINQLWYNQGNTAPGTFISKPFGFIGSWMGIAQGDLNCDGKLDLFVSNFGSYARDVVSALFNPISLNYPTRWFFNDDSVNGNFEPDSNNIFNFDFVSPFGFGCAMFDYDNDNDLDILVHGALDASILGIIADNPGTIFENKDGCFNDVGIIDIEETELFDINQQCVDITGVPGCTYHTTRNIWAMAVGDLDNDGFYDIVSTSTSTIDLDEFGSPELIPAKGDDILDKTAFKFPAYQTLLFNLSQPQSTWEIRWEGFEPSPGDLFVDISSGNKNKFVKIRVKGSKDICLVDGNVNRDGIGAILSFTPKCNKNNCNSNTITQAITGGESMASGNSFEKIFGLGRNGNKGDLEIKWPKPNGGYNINILKDIKKSESLTIYEIPCDYKTRYNDFISYKFCVEKSVDSLYYQGLISKKLNNRLKRSMV